MLKALKYSLPIFLLPILVGAGFYYGGWWSFLPLLFSFGLVPFIELFYKGETENLTPEEEAIERKVVWYDYLLYITVGTQYVILIMFAYRLAQLDLTVLEYVGMILSFGLLCGIFGINLGHELGHRSKPYEQKMAKALLLTSLYMHFFIEHNRGHHKNIATPLDPATARYNEPLYLFYFRSIVGSWKSAWELEAHRLKKLNLSFWSWQNEMLRYQCIQVIYLVSLFVIFSVVGPFGVKSGLVVVLGCICSALVGILLLETVNYIEHYGLLRKEVSPGRYEKVKPIHSWNSNHVMGRLLLFELTRHSDHHYNAGRKYQILRHFDESPQMPTGYPGMILCALVPPLWFKIMNPLVISHRKQSLENPEA